MSRVAGATPMLRSGHPHGSARTTHSRQVSAAIAVAFLAALLVVCASPSMSRAATADVATPLVTLTGGSARTMTSATDPISFPISVTAQGADATVSVTDVTRSSVSRATDSLTAVIDADSRALIVMVNDADQFAQQGTYDVTLLFTARADAQSTPAAAPVTQSLGLTLTRAAATIATGETVKVTRYVGPFADVIPFTNRDPFDGHRPLADHSSISHIVDLVVDRSPFALGTLFPSSSPPLTLTVGSDGELLSLAAAQKDRSAGSVTITGVCADVGGDSAPASAVARACNSEDRECPPGSATSITFTKPIPADGMVTLGYRLDDFPLGTTTRQVEIRSPQLAQPTSVTFEVTTALSPILIPIIVLIGVLVGHLVRVWLPALSARGQSEKIRNELSSIASTIGTTYASSNEHEARSVGDLELYWALQPITNALANPLTRAKLDRQQIALADALAAANTRLAEAKKAATDAATSIKGQWMLPPHLVSILDAAKTNAEAAQSAVNAHHLAESLQLNERVTANLSRLVAQANEWMRLFRERLVFAGEALPVDGGDPELVSLRDQLIKPQSMSVEPAADANSALTRASDTMQFWATSLRPQLLRVAAEHLDNGDAVDLHNALEQPDPVDALRRAVAPLKQITTATTPTRELLALRSAVNADLSPLDNARETLIDVPITPINPLTVSLAVGLGWAARALQFVLLAIVAALVVLLTSQSTWVGTPDQIAIVFGWAFALTLSVDAVQGMFGSDAKLPKIASPTA